MANCVRSGVHYRRHKFAKGKCTRCGQAQIQASVDRDKRQGKS